MKQKKPKVLVLTRSAWNNNNSLGNTLSNFFQESPFEISNLYCREDSPQNTLCNSYFKISEKQFVTSILKRKNIVGENFNIVEHDNSITQQNDNSNIEIKAYDIFRSHRFIILLWLREILWGTGLWKNDRLSDFLYNTKPDIIFAPVFNTFYTANLIQYIVKQTNAKLILFHADDYVTNRQYSLNPLFWINRKILQHFISKSVQISDFNYCITDKQKEEYSKIFNRGFSILQKGVKFSVKQNESKVLNSPIKIVFAGNITSGRYISLGKVGKALANLNKKSIKAQLIIYSQNRLTRKMAKILNIGDTVVFKGSIPNEELKGVLNDSDILIHVESLGKKSRLETRLSFSTKIVDYFQAGKCIMAIGWRDAASIDYLIKNDAAIIATNELEIEKKLQMLINNPKIIIEYGEKARDCGKRNHQINKIQEGLVDDFIKLL